MTRQKQTKILERFNSKVDKLDQCDFIKDAKGGGALVSYQSGKGWDGIHIGPSGITNDATVLTLRFFLQDNERISLHNMSELYRKLCVSATLISKFLGLRQEINDYLDSASGLSISDEGQMTHREILELFLYGSQAHLNQDKADVYESVSQTAFSPLFRADFTETVVFLILKLKRLQQINSETIKELR